MSTTLEENDSPGEIGAMSLAEFCASYKMDRSTFHRLRCKGQAPAILKVGKKVLITPRAIREWERAMTVQS